MTCEVITDHPGTKTNTPSPPRRVPRRADLCKGRRRGIRVRVTDNLCFCVSSPCTNYVVLGWIPLLMPSHALTVRVRDFVFPLWDPPPSSPPNLVGTCLLWFRSQFVRHARLEVVAWRSHEKRHCGAQPRRHLGGIFASCAWACACSDVLYSFHHIHTLVAFFSVDVRIQTLLFEKKREKKKTTAAAAPAAATTHVLPQHAQRRRLSIICRQQQQKTKP